MHFIFRKKIFFFSICFHRKYPSLLELASELVIILDHFKLNQVTCMGEGAGANICARFAMQHPNRCLGVTLIHPSGGSASLVETFKDKLDNLISTTEYLIWHRFGQSSGDQTLVQANIKEFQQKIDKTRNLKNLSLFVDSYLKYKFVQNLVRKILYFKSFIFQSHKHYRKIR